MKYLGLWKVSMSKGEVKNLPVLRQSNGAKIRAMPFDSGEQSLKISIKLLSDLWVAITGVN